MLLPLYTLETERIWMFLTPLVVIPAADYLSRRRLQGKGAALLPTVMMILLMAQTVATEVLLDTNWKITE